YQSPARATEGTARRSRDRIRADWAAIVGFITVSDSSPGRAKPARAKENPPASQFRTFGSRTGGLSLYTPADESFGLEVEPGQRAGLHRDDLRPERQRLQDGARHPGGERAGD